MSGIRASSLFWIIIVFFLLLMPIGSSFYKYYFSKDYKYLIEAACEPSIEICFSRDCSNPDNCPPNGLSLFKEYYVKAYDFEKCSDNSCAKECEKGQIKCSPINCGDSVDDVCTPAPK